MFLRIKTVSDVGQPGIHAREWISPASVIYFVEVREKERETFTDCLLLITETGQHSQKENKDGKEESRISVKLSVAHKY